MTTTTTVYVVRDASGEYISGHADSRRTPCSDEAREYESYDDALAATTRETDIVLSREVD